MTPARDPGTYTLAERHLIRTPVRFLDETGLLHKPADLYFGVGMIKGSPASDLTRMMRNWRDRHHYYDEVKFHGLNKGVLTYYLELATLFCGLPDSTSFHAFVLEKEPGWEGRFGSVDRVYELLVRQMLKGACGKGEILTVIADEYSTGPKVKFEEQVTEWVNQGLGRLAVTQVVRVSSHGVDGIQLGDLLLGAIAYDCKLRVGLIPPKGTSPKRVFVQALRDHLGVLSLAEPFRSGKFNIAFHGRPLA